MGRASIAPRVLHLFYIKKIFSSIFALGPLSMRALCLLFWEKVAFGGGAYWMAVRYQEELLAAPVLPTACARAWGLLTAATEDFRQYD
jgi:hypothetical protein